MPMEITCVYLMLIMTTHHRHNPLEFEGCHWFLWKDDTLCCLLGQWSFQFSPSLITLSVQVDELLNIYEAANTKLPGQNLCVDTYFGEKLSQLSHVFQWQIEPVSLQKSRCECKGSSERLVISASGCCLLCHLLSRLFPKFTWK